MTRMKESGIDWIGQIPEEWEVKDIKHIFEEIGSGATPKSDNETFYDGDINWIQSGDLYQTEEVIKVSKTITYQGFQSTSALKIYKHPFIALAMYGASVGNVAISCIDACVNQAVVVMLGTSEKVRFGKYAIEASKNNLIFSAQGGTQPNISQILIKNWNIPQPDSSEQTKIADFLDKKTAQLDKVKGLLEEQIQKLKDYRASLIYEIVTKGLDKTVPMKDSGIDWIGQMPQGWGVSKLKFILEKGSNSIKVGPFGSSLSGDAIRSSGKWVYNQRNVLDNNFTETDFYISEAKCKELKNFSVSSGDILLTTRGTIGRVAIVPKKYCEGIIHPCLMKFKVDSKIVLPELIKYLFNDIPLVREQLNFLSNSTTIDVIYSYNLKNIIVPTIPIAKQYSILEVLDRQTSDVDSLIKIKQKQIENINKQRQTLIYDYVTGKRRV